MCEKGHEWEASPHNRNFGTGCPYCAGRFAIKGETDLMTLYPDIAEEWHPTKNKGITPLDITPRSSTKKYWWLCPNCGNEYRAYAYQRTTTGSGCPKCAGKVR